MVNITNFDKIFYYEQDLSMAKMNLMIQGRPVHLLALQMERRIPIRWS